MSFAHRLGKVAKKNLGKSVETIQAEVSAASSSTPEAIIRSTIRTDIRVKQPDDHPARKKNSPPLSPDLPPFGLDDLYIGIDDETPSLAPMPGWTNLYMPDKLDDPNNLGFEDNNPLEGTVPSNFVSKALLLFVLTWLYHIERADQFNQFRTKMEMTKVMLEAESLSFLVLKMTIYPQVQWKKLLLSFMGSLERGHLLSLCGLTTWNTSIPLRRLLNQHPIAQCATWRGLQHTVAMIALGQICFVGTVAMLDTWACRFIK